MCKKKSNAEITCTEDGRKKLTIPKTKPLKKLVWSPSTQHDLLLLYDEIPKTVFIQLWAGARDIELLNENCSFKIGLIDR